jgi:ferric-dicitrate binding protein FerR (iron transport regulator)
VSKAFDKVVGEAKREFGTDAADRVDWSRVEAGLFSRIEKEQQVERSHRARVSAYAWTNIAAAMAAAAIVVVLLARRGPPPSAVDVDAATIVAIGDGGDVLVNGHPSAIGASVRHGDIVEARGAQASLSRPGKVTFVLEAGAEVTVTHPRDARGPLVLALDRGAIEAQVVPVASGEAFAVDIGGSRVAVHGTHLRVARDGVNVAVDLSEGVVTVGEAPRVGSVLGSLVTAPAHVDFSSDASGTLRVTHDPASVRAPRLGSASTVAPASEVVARPTAETRTARSAPTVAGESHVAQNTAPRAAVPAAADSVAEAVAPAATVPVGAVSAEAVVPTADPETAIANAVRACMAARPLPDTMKIVVSTTLLVELADDGSVRAAQFTPPVAPDVNGCAAAAIYKTRFTHGGKAVIRVDFTN